MSWIRRALLAMAGLSFVLAAACFNPVSAPYDADLAGLEDATVAWEAEWFGEDEYWALLRADFFVSNGETGEPYNNVVLEVISSYTGVYILPTGVINVENCPEGEAQWGTYCSDPNQTWGELTGNFNDNLTPTFYRGYTNGRGVETVWIWIEDMPVSGDSVGDVTIWATIGHDTESFTIKAESSSN